MIWPATRWSSKSGANCAQCALTQPVRALKRDQPGHPAAAHSLSWFATRVGELTTALVQQQDEGAVALSHATRRLLCLQTALEEYVQLRKNYDALEARRFSARTAAQGAQEQFAVLTAKLTAELDSNNDSRREQTQREGAMQTLRDEFESKHHRHEATLRALPNEAPSLAEFASTLTRVLQQKSTHQPASGTPVLSEGVELAMQKDAARGHIGKMRSRCVAADGDAHTCLCQGAEALGQASLLLEAHAKRLAELELPPDEYARYSVHAEWVDFLSSARKDDQSCNPPPCAGEPLDQTANHAKDQMASLRAVALSCAETHAVMSSLAVPGISCGLLAEINTLHAKVTASLAPAASTASVRGPTSVVQDARRLALLAELCTVWDAMSQQRPGHAMSDLINAVDEARAHTGKLPHATDPVVAQAANAITLWDSLLSDTDHATEGSVNVVEGLRDISAAMTSLAPLLTDATVSSTVRETATWVCKWCDAASHLHVTFSSVIVPEVQKALLSNESGFDAVATELQHFSEQLQMWRSGWETNEAKLRATHGAIDDSVRGMALLKFEEARQAKVDASELGWEDAYEWEDQRGLLSERRSKLHETDRLLESEAEQLTKQHIALSEQIKHLTRRWSDVLCHTPSGSVAAGGISSIPCTVRLLLSAFDRLFQGVEEAMLGLSAQAAQTSHAASGRPSLKGTALTTPTFEREAFFCAKVLYIHSVFALCGQSAADRMQHAAGSTSLDSHAVYGARRAEMVECLSALIRGCLSLGFVRRAIDYSCEHLLSETCQSLHEFSAAADSFKTTRGCQDGSRARDWARIVSTLQTTTCDADAISGARLLIRLNLLSQRLDRLQDWARDHVSRLGCEVADHKKTIARMAWLNQNKLASPLQGDSRQQLVDGLRAAIKALSSAQAKFVAMTGTFHRLLGELKPLVLIPGRSAFSQQSSREDAGCERATQAWEAAVAMHLEALGRVLEHLNQAMRMCVGLLSFEASSQIDRRGLDPELDAAEAVARETVARYRTATARLVQSSRNVQALQEETARAALHADAANREARAFDCEVERLGSQVLAAQRQVWLEARSLSPVACEVVARLSDPGFKLEQTGATGEAPSPRDVELSCEPMWQQVHGLVETLSRVTTAELANCDLLGLPALRTLNYKAIALGSIVRNVRRKHDKFASALEPFSRGTNPDLEQLARPEGTPTGFSGSLVEDDSGKEGQEDISAQSAAAPTSSSPDSATAVRAAEVLFAHLRHDSSDWLADAQQLPNDWAAAHEQLLQLTAAASRSSKLDASDMKGDDDENENQHGQTAELAQLAPLPQSAALSLAATSHADSHTNARTQQRNEHAVSVLRRVKAKLEGRADVVPGRPANNDARASVSGHVHWLIEQARSEDNLCRIFEGWAPW